MGDIIDKKILSSTYPLLEKFRMVAPGTYKHCQNVALLGEPIAIELKLDVDIIKASALYHDIGKINNPLYFSENQPDESNVHDDLDPYISFQLISRHVGDGVLYLMQDSNFPYKVIEIISQHHGDTILKSMHSKAKSCPEDMFRYKCPKPNMIESEILMIIDAIEATSRSYFNNKKEGDDIKEIIEKSVSGTISRLDNDNQLDNMKVGVLKVVKSILIRELESIYHKRETYNKETIEEK